MKYCSSCKDKKAQVIRPKTQEPTCLECFFEQFESEIHYTIKSNDLFKAGERVAVGASGGKDSTVLAYILNLLNKKYNYGLDLVLLSVDEGITGYRDDSLATVQNNKVSYGLPLLIVSYTELYGWTMDQIVSHLKQLQMEEQQTGKNNQGNNCTFCGVFRRQALDRGAHQIKADKVVTGHNADDIAETVLMNILRGDFFRLQKCVDIITGVDSLDTQPEDHLQLKLLPRVKPFKYTYEKEIVMYAYHKKLEYFSTECIYSPTAYRGYVRALIKDLEKIRASSVIDIIHSGEQLAIKHTVQRPTKMKCIQCGFIASNKLCKACGLLQRLNAQKTKLQLKYHNQEDVSNTQQIPLQTS